MRRSWGWNSISWWTLCIWCRSWGPWWHAWSSRYHPRETIGWVRRLVPLWNCCSRFLSSWCWNDITQRLYYQSSPVSDQTVSHPLPHTATRRWSREGLATHTQWNQPPLTRCFFLFICFLLRLLFQLNVDLLGSLTDTLIFPIIITLNLIEMTDKSVICSFEVADLFFTLIQQIILKRNVFLQLSDFSLISFLLWLDLLL